MNSIVQRILAYLPALDRQIWLLMLGRLLSQIGTGFTLFYAPIFFTNQVGLSATIVGIGIGSGSITGVAGRILGGSFADSPQWGRRKTLLLSAIVSTVGDFILALSNDFTSFLIGNLLMGLGVGLYWPATEAVVADLATLDQRNEAFALTRLADSLGLGLGVILGGWLVAATSAYRALFWIDGISFIIFFLLIYRTITETLLPPDGDRSFFQGWNIALTDKILLIYTVVNILFTSYLALINSALPLYFSQFVYRHAPTRGFAPTTLSVLFTWHIVLTAVCQLPVARALYRLNHARALMVSAGLWAIGFLLIWATGALAIGQLIWAILGLGILALATVAYMPAAASLVVDLAPVAQRGVYLSINSLCWAAGYFIGPSVGGWAMDQSSEWADRFWLIVAASVVGAIVVLVVLEKKIKALRE
jgi:MFS family permease